MKLEVCFVHKNDVINCGSNWLYNYAGLDWYDEVKKNVGEVNDSLIHNNIPPFRKNELFVPVHKDFARQSGLFTSKGIVIVKLQERLDNYCYLSHEVNRDSENQAITSIYPKWVVNEVAILESWRYANFPTVAASL